MASYAMGITELDPLAHGLIFERFLNPERISMPDVDVDFDDRRRGEVIRYVTEKYGDDRVAQIVTYGTIKAKQALKDSSRVLGMPYSVGEKLTKAMPPSVMGKDIGLADVLDKNAERYKEAGDLRGIIEMDAEAAKVFETALGIENLKRQWGVHAAGVLMSAEPLIDVLPIMKREDDGAIITQFDQPPLEDLGLLKMDFLGLRNLTVIEDALRMIEANTGERLVIEDLDLDGDPKTYALLARGETLGVFQLDGGPMRSLLKQLKPTNFEDISAVIALYRPGPMGMNSHTNYALRKNGLQQVDAIHQELEEPLSEILDTTFGLIVYQEQVMSVAQKVAGFTLGQADVLRRAMGKKKKSELDKQYAAFEAGMRGNGYSTGAVKVLWDTLMPFADYAFNKAHSAGYGVLAYWTAYLKANHPAEYMAALLTSVGDAKDKLGLYLSECRRMGLKVLPPDVNESLGDFAADRRRRPVRPRRGPQRRLQRRRADRRGAGEGRPVHLVPRLPAQGPAAGREQAHGRVAHQGGGVRLARGDPAGDARDPRGRRRCRGVSSSAPRRTGRSDSTSTRLWDEPQQDQGVPDRPEWAKRDKLAFEREMLGLYVSDHPLAGLEVQLAKHQTVSITELIDGDGTDGEQVTIAGLVTSVQHRVARNTGNQYGIVQVEDFGGEIIGACSSARPTRSSRRPSPATRSSWCAAGSRLRDDGMNLHAVSMFTPEYRAVASARVRS